MKNLVWLLKWILKAAIFFTLFAFALNNQQDATVHFFFGTQWRAPMVLVVLAAFAAGLMLGALAMVPRWWRHRHSAVRGVTMPATPAPPHAMAPAVPGGNQDASLTSVPRHSAIPSPNCSGGIALCASTRPLAISTRRISDAPSRPVLS